MGSPFVLTAQLEFQVSNGSLKAITDRVNQQLKNVGGEISFNVNSTSAASIANISRSTQQLSRDIQSVSLNAKEGGRAVQDFGEQVALAARRFAAFSIGPVAIAGVAYGFKTALTEAFAFEKELIRLEQISGRTKDSLNDVVETITELSKNLGVSSAELIQSATTLTQAGVAANDLNTALTAVAKASLAPTFGSIEEATQGALGLFKQFGVQANEFEKSFGAINAVASRFSTEAKEINTAISRTGAAFKAAGGDVNELIALFSAVRGTTRETAESVSTGLRTIFSRLQRSSTIDALKQLDIQLRVTHDEAQKLGDVSLEGNFVGAFEAAKRLGEALKNLSTTDPRFANIAEQLGGYRQIEKTIPLLQQMTTAQSALNVALAGSASLNSSAEKAQEGFLNKLVKLREEFFELGRTISNNTSFKVFLDVLTGGASAAIQLANALTPLIPLIATIGIAKAVPTIIPFATGLAERVGRPVLFAHGGVVPGHGIGDSVHARMEPGEFVVKKSSARAIGYDRLQAWNNSPEHFAEGGFIDNLKGINSLRGNRKQPLSVVRGIRLASEENADRLKSIIPDDAQYIGNGVEALVVGSPKKDFVYRIVPNQAGKSGRIRRFPYSGRSDHPDILQPESIHTVGGLTIEKLPYVQSVGDGGLGQENSFADDYESLRKRIPQHGVIDAHISNVGYYNGQLKILDAGSDALTDHLRRFSPNHQSTRPQGRELAVGGFIPHPQQNNDYETLVHVDPQKLNEAWKKDNSYLGDDYQDPQKRIARFKEFLKKKEAIQASRVSLQSDGSVGFTDGRHRFSVLRDMGEQSVGLTVPKDQKDEFLKRFGHANGGPIGRDTIPAMLEPGEFVFNKDAVRGIGAHTLHRWNKEGKVSHFANGGVVGLETGGQPQQITSSIGNLGSKLSSLGVDIEVFNELISSIRANAIANKRFADLLNDGGQVIVQVTQGFAELKGVTTGSVKQDRLNIPTVDSARIASTPPYKKSLVNQGGYDIYDIPTSPLPVGRVDIFNQTEKGPIKPYRVSKNPRNPSFRDNIDRSALDTVTGYNIQPFDELTNGGRYSSKTDPKYLTSNEENRFGNHFKSLGTQIQSNDPNFIGPLQPSLKSGAFNYDETIRQEASKQLIKKHGVDINDASNLDKDEVGVEGNAQKEIRLAKNRIDRELINQETLLVQAITPGISSEEAKLKATQNYVEAIKRGEKVLIDSSGKHIFESTSNKIEENGVTRGFNNRLVGPGSRFSNPFKGIGFNQDTLDRTRNLVSNPNFGFGASIVGSYTAAGLDSLAGNAQQAVDNHSVGTFTGLRAASGFLGGASTGAFAGSLLPIPGGTAIGAVVGGLTGLATSLSSAAKEIQDVKIANSVKDIDLNLRKFNDKLENFGEFRSSTIGSIESIRSENFDKATSAATGFVTPFDAKTFSSVYTKLNNDTIGNAAPSIAQALSKEANEVGKNSLGKDLDKVKQNFVRFNADLIKIVADVNKVDTSVFEKQFGKSIEDGLRSASKNTQEKEVANFVIGLERLTAGVESALLATSDLENKFKGLTSLNLAPQSLNSVVANLNPLSPNQGAFRSALDITSGGLGAAGEQFRNQGNAAQSVANAFADVLPTLIRQAGNTEPGNLTANVQKNVESIIGPDSQLPEFKRAIGLLIEEIGRQPVGDLVRASGNDSSKIVETLLKPIIGSFADNAQKIVRLQEQQANTFIDNLTAINRHIGKINEGFDKFNNITLGSVKYSVSIEAENKGLRGTATDILPLGALQAPFLLGQRNLTTPQPGEKDIDPTNPEAIGNRLAVRNTQIAQAKTAVEQTRGTPGFDNALKNLSQLQLSAGNLTEALKRLAEQSNLNAGIQDKLNRIEQNRAGRENFVAGYIGADANGKSEIERGLLLLKKASSVDKNGKLSTDIRSFTYEDQALALKTASSLGGGQVPINGKNISGDNLRESIIANFLGGSLLDNKQQGEKDKLQDEASDNFEKAGQSQDILNKNNEAFLTGLEKTLADIQKQFFTELLNIERQRVGSAAQNALVTASSEESKVKAKQGSYNTLGKLGITNDSTLDYAKANQSKILEYFSAGEKANKIQATASRFDATKINDFSDNKSLINNLISQGLNPDQAGLSINRFRKEVRSSPVYSFAGKDTLQGLLSDSVSSQLGEEAETERQKKKDLREQLPVGQYKNILPANLPPGVSTDQFSKALGTFDSGSGALEGFVKSLKDATDAVTKATENLNSANPKTFATGGMARGTDTVPAMLSPGEFIVNSRSASKNMKLLHDINNSGGRAVYAADGGSIFSTPEEFQSNRRFRDSQANNPFNQTESPLDRTFRDNTNPIGGNVNGRPTGEATLAIQLDNLERRAVFAGRKKHVQTEEQKATAQAKRYITAQFNKAAGSLAEKQAIAQTSDPLAYFGLGKAGIESQVSLQIGAVTSKEKADLSISRRAERDYNYAHPAFGDLFSKIRASRQSPQLFPLPYFPYAPKEPKKFATGGLVDSVPAMLSPGEYVMNPSAVRGIGVHNLDKMNYFSDGGSVNTLGVPLLGLLAGVGQSSSPVVSGSGSANNSSSGGGKPVDFGAFSSGVEAFSTASSLLNKSFVLFDSAATKLGDIMEKFPRTIAIEGNQNLNVVINGAETIASIMPSLKEYVEKSVSDAIDNMVRKNIPDA